MKTVNYDTADEPSSSEYAPSTFGCFATCMADPFCIYVKREIRPLDEFSQCNIYYTLNATFPASSDGEIAAFKGLRFSIMFILFLTILIITN